VKIDVLNTDGKSTGKKVELPDEIFAIEPNDHAIYLDVKRYRNAQRQGTHKAKDRNEVARSTRKLKRQKGTGTARAGSAKNPLYKGGGRVFAPEPRDYRIKLNKKVTVLARKSALTYKAKGEGLVVIEDLKLQAPKTKDFAGIIGNLELAGRRTLFVIADADNTITLSARNIPRVKVSRAADLNTYEIVEAETLVLSRGAIEKISEVLSDN
jgi:large subunit ribosomal protein L4